jgi:hypothetical protein
MLCEGTDFAFPMQADIYHAITTSDAFGAQIKRWVPDRTVACSFASAGSAFKEEVVPNVNITINQVLVGRTKTDPRISSYDKEGITSVVITNIKDATGANVFIETTGKRKSESTIFEIATIQPYIGPFGSIEYYKILLKRSESQDPRI